MELSQILKSAVEKQASDIFIVSGLPLSFKVNHVIEPQSEEKLFPDATEALIREIYSLANERDIDRFLDCGDDDFSFSLPGVSRFRVSTYKQRSSLAAVIRVVTFDLPDPEKLGLPSVMMDLALRKKGMVLVTGPAGSGKSTSLACMIDRIIDAFPPNQQAQIRIQLSMVIQAVVSQQLIPTVNGGVVAAFEIMICNGAIRNLIRESKTHQIDTVIFSSASDGMITMDNSILNLYKQGIISAQDAVLYSTNPELMSKKVR